MSASILSAVKLLFIPFGGPAIGLVLSTLAANGAGVGFLTWNARTNQWLSRWRHRTASLGSSFTHLRAAALRNTEYPLFLTWSSLMNSASGQVPVLLVAGLLSSTAAGQFFLAFRLIARPSLIVINSVADATFVDAAGDRSSMRTMYTKRLQLLAWFGVGPFVAVYLISPWFFPHFFGSNWAEAGHLTRALVPGLFVQFIFTPFSNLFTVLRAQRQYLWWSALRFGLVSAGVWIGVLGWGTAGAAHGLSVALMISFVLQHALLLHVLAAPVSTELTGDS